MLLAIVTIAFILPAGVVAGSAAAAPSHLWDGCASGDSDLPLGQQCSLPRGLATASDTGYVFVGDHQDRRIVELNPWGDFVKAWGWDVVANGPGDDTTLPEDQFEVCVPANGDVCKNGIEGTDGVGQFGIPSGVALDAAGNVYVFDALALRVQKFSPQGEFLLMFGGGVNQGGGSPESPGNICTVEHLENGDTCGAGTSGSANGQFGDVPRVSTLIAITLGSKVYVGDIGRVQRFDTNGAYQGQVTTGGTAQNVAVDTSGNLYLSFVSGPDVVKVAPVDGPVGPNLAKYKATNPRGLAIAPNNEVYVFDAAGSQIKRYASGPTSAEGANPVESFGEGFSSESVGLATNAVTNAGGIDVYFANASPGFVRAYGPPPDKWPPPAVPPQIKAQYADAVSTDGADVGALIDPRFHADTSYFVEYGTADCDTGGCPNRVPLADAPLGAGITGFDVTVSAFIGGLEPGTTYFYRFVAQSGGGGPVRGTGGTEALDGPSASFTTFPVATAPASCPNDALRTGVSAALPDCRAYEMVSPLDKNGGDIQAAARPIGTVGRYTSYKQAALDGNRITYSAATSFGDAPSGPFASQYLSSRGEGGWSTHGISPPRGTAVFEGKGTPVPLVSWDAENPFEAFTEDLCHAWLRDTNLAPLTADALRGYVNLYRRTNCGVEGYEALSKDMIGAPGAPSPFEPASEYLNDDDEGLIPATGPGLRLQGYSADLRHQVFVSGAALLPEEVGFNAKCSTTTTATTVSYRWLRNGAPIEGATAATYTFTPADAGAAIQCQVFAINANAGSTRVANPARIVAPVPTTMPPLTPETIPAPTSSATLSVGGPGGQILTCDSKAEQWSGSPSFSYAWYRNGVAILGAEGPTYTVSAGDLITRAAFQCAVSGTNAGGTVTAASANRLTSPPPAGPAAPNVNASMGGRTPRLYDQHDGELKLVSIMPNGAADTENSVAGTLGTSLENRQSSLGQAISDDGSRIFWTSKSGPIAAGPGKLYVRVNPGQPESISKDSEGNCLPEPGKACTLRVSEVVSGKEARFWTATPDGSVALFTICGGVGPPGFCPTAPPGECLYRFDVDAALVGAGEPASKIACRVLGVLGAADDLSRIYFVSREALAAGTTEGETNLYLLEGGAVRLVARLSGADAAPGLISPVHPSPVFRTSRATPDGGQIAFQALGSLTDYDNVDPADGKRYTEVYRYDAETDELVCVSCNPTGARPSGPPIPQPYDALGGSLEGKVGVVDFADLFGAAALLPTWEREQYASRVFSDDGKRIYFHSYEALVARDTNGVRDVYQWEAPGTGSCRVDGPGYVGQNGGCLELISTDTSPQASEFVDASTTGDDVFISTTSNIHPDDEGPIDIYDARVGGGFPAPLEPPECLGNACQSIPPAPNDPTPAGAVFSGPESTVRTINCGALARRAARLSRRAKNLRQSTAWMPSVQRSKQLHRRAAQLGERAARLSKKAKRCKRQGRKGSK